MTITRRFVVGGHEDVGSFGLCPVSDNGYPISDVGLLFHDIIEHRDGGDMGPQDECWALGASHFVRWETGIAMSQARAKRWGRVSHSFADWISGDVARCVSESNRNGEIQKPPRRRNRDEDVIWTEFDKDDFDKIWEDVYSEIFDEYSDDAESATQKKRWCILNTARAIDWMQQGYEWASAHYKAYEVELMELWHHMSKPGSRTAEAIEFFSNADDMEGVAVTVTIDLAMDGFITIEIEPDLGGIDYEDGEEPYVEDGPWTDRLSG